MSTYHQTFAEKSRDTKKTASHQLSFQGWKQQALGREIDTLGQKNNKMQRRVLTKTLSELHSKYNQASSVTQQMSYRQFACYRPKHITEARPTDRNTCACYQHDNMRLLIDSFFKGMISTKSLSNLPLLVTKSFLPPILNIGWLTVCHYGLIICSISDSSRMSNFSCCCYKI